jgi:hypothetical protein
MTMIVTTTPTIEGHTIKEYNLAALLYPDVVRRQIHRVSFLVVSAVDAHPLLVLLPQA